MDTFLLSPAFCSGRRAAILRRDGSTLDIAARLSAGTLTLGEAFAFLSGLYFRGKLTYATAFAAANGPDDRGEVLVITPTRGLLRPDTPILPGVYRLLWDARDDKGFEVPSGQYFYRFTAPKYHKTRKMILVK